MAGEWGLSRVLGGWSLFTTLVDHVNNYQHLCFSPVVLPDRMGALFSV